MVGRLRRRVQVPEGLVARFSGLKWTKAEKKRGQATGSEWRGIGDLVGCDALGIHSLRALRRRLRPRARAPELRSRPQLGFFTFFEGFSHVYTCSLQP